MKQIWNKYNFLGKVCVVLPCFALATACYLAEKAGAYLINKLADKFIKE